jgi:hypothetical protein
MTRALFFFLKGSYTVLKTERILAEKRANETCVRTLIVGILHNYWSPLLLSHPQLVSY